MRTTPAGDSRGSCRHRLRGLWARGSRFGASRGRDVLKRGRGGELGAARVSAGSSVPLSTFGSTRWIIFEDRSLTVLWTCIDLRWPPLLLWVEVRVGLDPGWRSQA